MRGMAGRGVGFQCRSFTPPLAFHYINHFLYHRCLSTANVPHCRSPKFRSLRRWWENTATAAERAGFQRLVAEKRVTSSPPTPFGPANQRQNYRQPTPV